jgi:hypothetical protein
MAPKEPKISKHATAGKTRDIILTIPKTLEIIWKPVSATNQSIIMAAYKIELLTTYTVKKRKERIMCKNLHRYGYCLINEILNTLVPLQ